ncbi:MAG: transcription elongation factor GreA [Proteobacteria bacterium]|nr:transcription elongation factor GreA [Pseudomonadota bacterium]MCH9757689.1 transcription elongation factor GreA [Pseudomonadota bacterium]
MGTPITQEGHTQLSAELDNLKSVERPAIIEAIAAARAHGDLKENAEYHSAKEKQGFIEARIKLLDSLLSSADIIDPATIGADGRCIFGSYVKLKNEDDKIVNYRLVGEFESDVENGLLSSTSPIGRALIGKYADDNIAIETPGGTKEYEILEIRYTAESTAENTD